MSESLIAGHAQILQTLEHVALKPAHGYLFAGPDGVGKRLIVSDLARRLLDLRTSDVLDAHPDFVRLVREEGAKELSVKQARDLMGRMNLTSARGGFKVALIEQADRLNEEAANALLKAIEEPPPRTVYLLVAERPERLPATLRSRLTQITLQRLSATEMRSWLESVGVVASDLDEAVRISRGCPGVARRWMEDRETMRIQSIEAQKIWQALQVGPVGQRLQAIERFARSVESAEDTEAAWRQALTQIMQVASRPTDDPAQSLRVGMGLMHAWQLAGSSLSPKLALEWAAVLPYIREDHSTFMFLTSSYL